MAKLLPLHVFFLSLVIALVALGGCEGQVESDEPTVDAGADARTAPPTKDAAADVEGADAKDPDDADDPDVVSVTPNTATVGSVGPTIVVTGSNFVERSLVQLDGAALATSFVSSTELRATIPSSKLTKVVNYRVSVGTAPPGGGASKDLTFTVVNPAPTVTALSPLSVLAGSGGAQLVVTGEGFVSDSKIVFGTTNLTTTFNSRTKLTGAIPSNLLVTSGSVPVKVVNAAPGGGTSSVISFTVSNPAASITSITPATANIGSAALTLTIDGTGFIASSKVLFNGNALTTTYTNGTRLSAQVPAAALAAAGEFPVAVQNQPPGGGVSAPVVFKVQYPTPVATSLNPATAAAGAAPTTITVTGTGFHPLSQITFDDAPQATTYVSSTQVRMTVPAAQLATAATHQVRVVTPSPGGGTSAALAFTVTNPSPILTSHSPGGIATGSPDTLVTLTGTGFIAASTVKVNNVDVAATLVNATTFTVTIPASQLATAGSLVFTVTTPAPGGGTSASRTLAVTPPVACTETGGAVFENHCYFLNTPAAPQATAQQACVTKGAHLVTITSAGERTFVNTLGTGDRWIGLTQPGTSTSKAAFTWTTGETPVPDFWKLGQPDGSQCVVINASGQFEDRYCTGNSYVGICERD